MEPRTSTSSTRSRTWSRRGVQSLKIHAKHRPWSIVTNIHLCKRHPSCSTLYFNTEDWDDYAALAAMPLPPRSSIDSSASVQLSVRRGEDGWDIVDSEEGIGSLREAGSSCDSLESEATLRAEEEKRRTSITIVPPRSASLPPLPYPTRSATFPKSILMTSKSANTISTISTTTISRPILPPPTGPLPPVPPRATSRALAPPRTPPNARELAARSNALTSLSSTISLQRAYLSLQSRHSQTLDRTLQMSSSLASAQDEVAQLHGKLQACREVMESLVAWGLSLRDENEVLRLEVGAGEGVGWRPDLKAFWRQLEAGEIVAADESSGELTVVDEEEDEEDAEGETEDGEGEDEDEEQQ